MVHIVGGFYQELCLYPEWNYHFGSGGRAAACLSQFGTEISFHTYINKRTQKSFKSFANAHKIKSYAVDSSEIIQFEYYHSLSTPNIYTLNNPLIKQEQMTVAEDIVICYGMMEASNPVIHADYVVFDPQSENTPSMIFDNGSTMNHLALVLNVEEGKKFTGKNTIQEISKALFKKSDSLEVLILKDGPFGAHIFYGDEYCHIDSYETENIFKIGSGDIFVAVFGYLWAYDKLSPLEAANKASLATAMYCNTKNIVVDKNKLFKEISFKKIKVNKESFEKKIYLAGPFFTMSERWLIEEAKGQLEKFGANVFSPLHDVGYGDASVVAKADLKGVDDADILYAVLNEYDPGTIFEIGYAISKNIPVIIFLENQTPINMTMFEGSGCIIENDFSSSIYKVIWEASKRS